MHKIPEADIDSCVVRLKGVTLKVQWQQMNINICRDGFAFHWYVFSSNQTHSQNRSTKKK